MDRRNLIIARNFRSWLVYQSENYTRNHLPGGSIIYYYESTVSESENEARWQVSGQYYSDRAQYVAVFFRKLSDRDRRYVT